MFDQTDIDLVLISRDSSNRQKQQSADQSIIGAAEINERLIQTSFVVLFLFVFLISVTIKPVIVYIINNKSNM